MGHWVSPSSPDRYYLDVSLTNDFSSYVSGYSNLNVGTSTALLVPNLIDGGIYYYRVRAGYLSSVSTNSNIISVPVSTNTPYVRYEVTNGVVSVGSTDVIPLTELFWGTGMDYDVPSISDTNLISTRFSGTDLILSYEQTGSVSVVVRVTDPNSSPSYSVETTIMLQIVPRPTWSAPTILDQLIWNPQISLFEHEVVVTNVSALDAQAVTLMVTNMPVELFYNATGVSPNGFPEIHWNGLLPAGGSRSFTLRFKKNAYTNIPALDVSFSLMATQTPPSGSAVSPEIQRMVPMTLHFKAVPGGKYAVQYKTSLLDANWTTVYPSITAYGNRVQWIDNGPPETECHPRDAKSRFYRVIKVSE